MNKKPHIVWVIDDIADSFKANMYSKPYIEKKAYDALKRELNQLKKKKEAK